VDVKSVLSLLLVGLVLVVFLVWAWVKIQEWYGIYFPRVYEPDRTRELPDGYEVVTFPGEAGQLSGVWKHGDEGEPLVILFHGNAGHALNRLEWMMKVVPEHWHGFVPDYRGYGASEGVPTEEGLYSDAVRAARYGRDRLDHERLIVHGRSLGVPVAAHVLEDVCPAGVVFESGFPSGRAVAKTILPLPGISWLTSVEFDTLGAVNRASSSCRSLPKLVVHGEADRVIPVALGRSLFDELPPPKDSLFVAGAGHNDLFRRGERYRRRIRQFYRDVVNE
jgi:fermentation-respiration switch protein FrsA (DUF1100 family)